MRGTLLTIEEELYNPMLAFSFYLYFHIRSSKKSNSFISAKMGVVQGVVHISPQHNPPVTVLGRHHRTRAIISIDFI